MKMIKTFTNRRLAWKFMHLCDELEIPAGFPNPVEGKPGSYTVTWILAK